jgi:hypothetical protein
VVRVGRLGRAKGLRTVARAHLDKARSGEGQLPAGLAARPRLPAVEVSRHWKSGRLNPANDDCGNASNHLTWGPLVTDIVLVALRRIGEHALAGCALFHGAVR